MKTKIFTFLFVLVLMTACSGVNNPIGASTPPAPTGTATETATVPPTATSSPTATETSTPADSVASGNPTWKFDYPNAGTASGDGWTIEGLPTTVDKTTVLVAQNPFVNTIGLGSQAWIADPGTVLVGPGFPQSTVDTAGGAIEYLDQINQELIDSPNEAFHLNEDRIDFCSFGSAVLEFNGVEGEFEYQEGHNYFLIIRGLFADGLQDTDRNHSILFHEVVGSHAQCMSYPANGGGFISEENFLQNATLSHTNGMDCGNEGCSGLTVMFVDLNTGALSVIYQSNLDQPWQFVASNWYQP